MPTYSVTASELKYASSSSWSSGKARQGVYSSTRYEGAINFSGLANFDFSNIDISQMQMQLTFGSAGGSSSKYLTFYKGAKNSISGSIASMRGDSIGAIYVSDAYNRTVTLTFNSSTNAGIFSTLRSFFSDGNQIQVIYVPSTRGTYSGGYCYDYMAVTAATLTLTYEYLQSDGSLASTSVAAGSAATMNINAYNTAYSHKVTWTFGSHSYTQVIASGSTVASYTIPLSWLDAIPSATSGSASVSLETIDTGGTSLGTYSYGFTITVPASVVPAISSVNASPVNDNSVIAGWGIYAYGKSKASLSISGAAGIFGSTIKSYSITTSPSIGSTTASALTTSLIYKTGTITVTAKVTDSRGRSATKSTTFSVYAYGGPYFSTVEAYRCNSDGTQNETEGSYAYLKVNFGRYVLNGNNAVTAKVVLAQVGGAYTTTATLTSGTAVILGGGSLAVDAAYTATITLTDTVGSVSTYVADINSAAYIMHIKKGGRAVGFGMAAGDDETVSFGWPVKMTTPLGLPDGGTGADTASGACTNIGAVNKTGDTMTGNLAIQGYLYPSVYFQPTYNSVPYRGVMEGSYVGSASFSIFEDANGDNRRMIEVRSASYQPSMDYAAVLRTAVNGSYSLYRFFHSGMATPIPVANGGTGASAGKAALNNLGVFYAETLPASGTDGQICLIPV